MTQSPFLRSVAVIALWNAAPCACTPLALKPRQLSAWEANYVCSARQAAEAKLESALAAEAKLRAELEDAKESAAKQAQQEGATHQALKNSGPHQAPLQPPAPAMAGASQAPPAPAHRCVPSAQLKPCLRALNGGMIVLSIVKMITIM